jgi:hypothetical protein
MIPGTAVLNFTSRKASVMPLLGVVLCPETLATVDTTAARIKKNSL